MGKYCIDCGKKVNDFLHFDITNRCKECAKKRIEINKEEQRKEKLQENKIKSAIIKEFKINKKIRELERILGKPCILEVSIANNGTFLFGRFVKRKFTIQPLKSKDRKIMQLCGKYKEINDFCKKARKIGFKVEMWDSTDASLEYKDKKFHFISEGIYLDGGRAGAFARVLSEKVADVKYELWGE